MSVFVNFDDFGFDQRIGAGIRSCGYKTPTPIQQQAMPPVLDGQDVMGLARTGSGKTAAFALPILQRLLDAEVYTGQSLRTGPARVLVLAPTRELALQIHETFVALGKQTGIRSAAVFGGVGITPQVNALRKATVVVACPGRLLDLMNQGRADMGRIDTLVLDEADRMLDMGFLPDIKRILARLPRQRQNLLFSATMPADIRALSRDILNNPAEVQVDRSAPTASVSHALYPVAQHLKGQLLRSLLDRIDYQSVLIFTRTKHKAKSLGRQLERGGYQATFLQGNLSQSQRQKALEGFRSGNFRIMVATDIAARGIDCATITHVINFDMPDTAETYTHRIGRTGRAGRSGESLTFATEDDGQMIRDIERALKTGIRRVTLDGFDYAAAKPQQDGRPQRGASGRSQHSASPLQDGEGRQSRGGRGGRSGQQARKGSRTDQSRKQARNDQSRADQARADQARNDQPRKQARRTDEAPAPLSARQQSSRSDGRAGQSAQQPSQQTRQQSMQQAGQADAPKPRRRRRPRRRPAAAR